MKIANVIFVSVLVLFSVGLVAFLGWQLDHIGSRTDDLLVRATSSADARQMLRPLEQYKKNLEVLGKLETADFKPFSVSLEGWISRLTRARAAENTKLLPDARVAIASFPRVAEGVVFTRYWPMVAVCLALWVIWLLLHFIVGRWRAALTPPKLLAV